MTEPFTTGFGAVPCPEEPERPGWAPPPVPYASFGAVSSGPPTSPTANASVTNNINFGGRHYGVRRCNHWMHFACTLLTFGMWAPVWLIAWWMDRRYNR